MEKKQNPLLNNLKANRILYAVVVGALCIVAVIIGIVAVANRAPSTDSTLTTPPAATSGTQPGTDGPSRPTGGEGDTEEVSYLCPLTGTVAKEHIVDSLVFSQTMGDWRTHTGIDIAAALGDKVCAVADGVIKEVWEDALMGTCVSISHGDDVVSTYKNLAPQLADGIKVGANVKAGSVLGAVGESAMAELADEPHLHFEMTQAGAPVDPLTLLSEESKSASLTVGDKTYED